MYKLLGAALLCCALTGCAGMNSDFDCNKTATDKCLTTAEANKLAAQGKSLNDIDNAVKVKKPAGEALPALHNTAPVVNPARPVSVAATGASSSAPLAARHASISPLSKPVTPLTRPASVITPLRPDTGVRAEQHIDYAWAVTGYGSQGASSDYVISLEGTEGGRQYMATKRAF
ncbi:TraV family lipoprotein, partial [Phytobacter massiliensis]|uniref:TraV family lipoprotein n=1 Tax=Phytobacter massiliensis TaxID=1485952 RepID=UPI0009DC21E9